ncbi:MAG: sigma-70 family RNA polymerase sigma factor [Myxococcota bacterium]|nr:sigma-70 family RNA polymerase sigma factor [Myxococcota bacterium]
MSTPDTHEQDPQRAAIEAPIRAACEAGDEAGAVTAALRLYGTELLAFLRALAGNDDLAAEAFAELGEDVWRGLPAFRWSSSLRSWLYTLARNALNQLRRDPRRRVDRNLPLSIAPDIEHVLRTATLDIQRTEVKDGFRLLREQLDPEEHELLLLRLDRELSWKEIARITGGDADVDARAATLRKRFERAKERLKKLALQHGLI